MRNSPLNAKTALVLGAAALVASTVACSRGELSAAERRDVDKPLTTDSSVVGRQALVGADSGGLLDLSQGQTTAPASIEEILMASPLRSAKADCATPVSETAKPREIGTQCLTDAPSKK